MRHLRPHEIGDHDGFGGSGFTDQTDALALLGDGVNEECRSAESGKKKGNNNGKSQTEKTHFNTSSSSQEICQPESVDHAENNDIVPFW